MEIGIMTTDDITFYDATISLHSILILVFANSFELQIIFTYCLLRSLMYDTNSANGPFMIIPGKANIE